MGENLLADPDRMVGALDDFARQVDARHERRDSGDLAIGACGQRVLVVDAGPLDADGDLAGRQRVGGEAIHSRMACLVVAFGDERPKCRGDLAHKGLLLHSYVPGGSASSRGQRQPVDAGMRPCTITETIPLRSPATMRQTGRDGPHIGLLEHVYALAAPPFGGWGLRQRT